MGSRDRSIEISQYCAFTDRSFAGNPAGVVTDAADLEEGLMQLIARQLNLSETAFLVPAESEEADVRIRWFTPTREVELCGHATIAAFTAAADEGLFAPTDASGRTLRVETLSGVLRIRIGMRDGRPEVAMQIPIPEFEPLAIDRDAFAAHWGAEPGALDGGPWLRNQLDYWYVPVTGLRALEQLTLHAEALRSIDPEAAFAFYTRETFDPDSDWHLRFFAPFHGVPEDPVTGSAQGPMGLLSYEHLSTERGGDGRFEFVGEQGDPIGRPGRVDVRLVVENDEARDLEIAGTAVRMLEGRLLI